MDLIKDEIKTKHWASDVRKMLGAPGVLDCLMLSTPTRKMSKKPTTLIFFSCLFFAIQAIVVINIYPHL